MTPRWFAATTIMLLVSGCAAADKDAPDLPPSSIDIRPGGGAVEGVVTDDEFIPIDGALVQIFNKAKPEVAPIILTTNSTGGFAARGVSAAEYRVFAAKEGYEETAPKLVSVADGVSVTVTFELRKVRVAEPYYESRSYRNEFTGEFCVYSPQEPECQGAFDPANLTLQVKANQSESGPLHGFVVETVWTANVGACSKGFQNHLYSPEQEGLDTTFPSGNEEHWGDENPFHWDNVPERTTSPTYLRITRDGTDLSAMFSEARTALNGGAPIQIEGTWIIQTWSYNEGAAGAPVDVGCTANQPIDIWVSTFFGAPPAADWTALEQ